MDGEKNLSEGGFGINTSTSDDMLSNILEALDSADSNQSSSSSSFELLQYYNDPLKSGFVECGENEMEPKWRKRQKVGELELGQPCRMSHIAVERNRRKQMNHHLSVLRSLMPCFYVKRGDQASIIGGVINYINELQQVMQSLEAKKKRKLGGYTSTNTSHDPPIHASIITSSSSSSSSSHIIINNPSPRKPPLSPRTPTPSCSPYNIHIIKPAPMPALISSSPLTSPCTNSSSAASDTLNELVATSKSAVAEVEVKFCGPNLVLNTLSHPIPGQLVKILSALQHLPLDILQLNINKLHQTIRNSFTIKIGIECQLSAEELAQQIQRTFC